MKPGGLVESIRGVTLIGGGTVAPEALRRAVVRAPCVVAADGGAAHALEAGLRPEAVIGDMDSLTGPTRARLAGVPLHRLAEQETTDFDKALRSITAPFVLALGFTGGRLDHTLAAFNVLARHPARRCLILDHEDLCFLAPCELSLNLAEGTRVSLFPMGPVEGRSDGLVWPIDGRRFAPSDIIGTSNAAAGGLVRLSLSAPRMLVLLPLAELEQALAALVPGAC